MIRGTVLAIHILAVIIWLGGIFFLTVVLGRNAASADRAAALSSWERALARFLPWGWLSLALILSTGVALVFLIFGGYANIPNIHRVNMVIGIPAIAGYAYLYFAPWRRFRRAVSAHDAATAEKSAGQVKTLMAAILTLGLLAAFMSAVGRYTGF